MQRADSVDRSLKRADGRSESRLVVTWVFPCAPHPREAFLSPAPCFCPLTQDALPEDYVMLGHLLNLSEPSSAHLRIETVTAPAYIILPQ